MKFPIRGPLENGSRRPLGCSGNHSIDGQYMPIGSLAAGLMIGNILRGSPHDPIIPHGTDSANNGGKQMKEIPHGCPSCGALPCDWVNTPTIEQSSIVQNEAEIVRLTKERDDAIENSCHDSVGDEWGHFLCPYKKQLATARNEAYAAGASQMRERAALACDVEAPGWHYVTGNPCVRLGKAIRALPLEESK